jgi:aldehyde:ferredoxin oxidoreductase
MKGVCGRLLEIDLSIGKTKDHAVSDDMIAKYIGGKGLGARLLLDMLPAGTRPLSPQNVLFFLTGPLTGTKVPGSSKFVVITKSPLTGGWCDSYSSGRLPGELKKLGYDGLLIRAKSNHPCYLRIDDSGVHIRAADAIWGKDSSEKHNAHC